MSADAIDSSVLIAILKGEQNGSAWLECLQTASETSSLIASSVVCAEIRAFFRSDNAFRDALRTLDIRHSSLTEDSSLLAGSIFRFYREEGGPRRTILPDFLVAAHAAVQADSFATQDRGYLHIYFPNIRLLSPSV